MINFKALVVRAAKTFAQAFVAVFLASLTLSINQVQPKALVIGAISAGLSALTNVFVKPQEAR